MKKGINNLSPLYIILFDDALTVFGVHKSMEFSFNDGQICLNDAATNIRMVVDIEDEPPVA
jgi:hypothetical protein